MGYTQCVYRRESKNIKVKKSYSTRKKYKNANNDGHIHLDKPVIVGVTVVGTSCGCNESPPSLS